MQVDEFGFEEIGLPPGASQDLDDFVACLERSGKVQPSSPTKMTGEISEAQRAALERLESEAQRSAGEAADLDAAGAPALIAAPAPGAGDFEMEEAEDRAKRLRQRPPEPPPMPPMPAPPGMEAFAALLDRKFEEQNRTNEKTFTSTLKKVISEEVGPVRQTVSQLQQEQTRQAQELLRLQTTVKQLQQASA